METSKVQSSARFAAIIAVAFLLGFVAVKIVFSKTTISISHTTHKGVPAYSELVDQPTVAIKDTDQIFKDSGCSCSACCSIK